MESAETLNIEYIIKGLALIHAGALSLYKQEEPCHRPVIQGGGKEAKEYGGGGTVGDIGEDLSSLWWTIGKCDGVQISGNCVDGGRWRLESSGGQPPEGEEELGADVADLDLGEGGNKGIRALLQSGSAGGVDFRGRDVGP